ncbi:MAG: oxygenase MpaB family protein [Segniliparus sp.]|uniref:oxygenase MpaB family protein n=1 Tax=Segniliparus sp. TaxID=2804064 RepID=UPI003F32B298
MTQDLAERNESGSAGQHPFDYYWRTGMELRPRPPRQSFGDLWTYARRGQLVPWIDFQETPRETELVKLVLDHHWQGDQLMDAVVARFREIGMAEGRKLLEQALDHGIDSIENPPEELVDLFAELDNPPDWHDPVVAERGRQLWADTSLAGKIGMGIGDVFGTFVGDEVAYATGATGRFVTDFGRRNLETSTWFLHVTVKDGLSRHGVGFKDTVRLRLMHAQVRAGLRRSWGNEAGTPAGFAHHGNPISAAMVMIAATTFGLQSLLIDHQHGRKRTWADLDATMAYWAYIAHVLGVPDEIIPRSAAQGIEIMDYGVAHAGGPSEWTEAQVGAAVNGKGRAGRVKQAVMTPVLGVLAYYGGTPMVRAMLRGTDMQDARFEPWILPYRVFAHANVTLRRVLDLLPGARRRTAERKEDLHWRALVRIGKLSARREGVQEASYDHHNATASIAPGAAIPRIGKCPMGH